MNLSLENISKTYISTFSDLQKSLNSTFPLFESFFWCHHHLACADDRFTTFTVTCYGLTDGINGFTKQCEGDDFGSIVKFHQLLAQRLPTSLQPLGRKQRRRRSRSSSHHQSSNGEDVPGGGCSKTRRVSGWGVSHLLGNAERFRCFSFFGWFESVGRFFFTDSIPWGSNHHYIHHHHYGKTFVILSNRPTFANLCKLYLLNRIVSNLPLSLRILPW